MNKLGIDQLHRLRLSIFDNAESLYKEAKLLFENDMYARSYLLAYFACEELGKIPMIVGAIGQIILGNDVNWKKLRKRFRNHNLKVKSEVFHHYVFGIDSDPIENKDFKWLEKEKEESHLKIDKKNESTYVDVVEGKIKLPSEQVTLKDASDLIEIAFNSLKAHWLSESQTNPIVILANKATSADLKKRLVD